MIRKKNPIRKKNMTSAGRSQLKFRVIRVIRVMWNVCCQASQRKWKSQTKRKVCCVTVRRC